MDLPLRYDITIPQRATFRERIQLPIDCTDREVIAQVWKVRNGRRIEPLLTFAVEWINRAVPITVTQEGETSVVIYGDFYLVGSWQDTAALEEPSQWDLLLIEGPSLPRAGERNYWLEGLASINQGLSTAAVEA